MPSPESLRMSARVIHRLGYPATARDLIALADQWQRERAAASVPAAPAPGAVGDVAEYLHQVAIQLGGVIAAGDGLSAEDVATLAPTLRALAGRLVPDAADRPNVLPFEPRRRQLRQAVEMGGAA